MVFCSRWEWGEVGVMNYFGVGQGSWLSWKWLLGLWGDEEGWDWTSFLREGGAWHSGWLWSLLKTFLSCCLLCRGPRLLRGLNILSKLIRKWPSWGTLRRCLEKPWGTHKRYVATPGGHSCDSVGRVTRESQGWCHVLYCSSVSVSVVLSLHRGYGCVQKILIFWWELGLTGRSVVICSMLVVMFLMGLVCQLGTPEGILLERKASTTASSGMPPAVPRLL